MLETEEMQYGCFLWEGRWYQICFEVESSRDFGDGFSFWDFEDAFYFVDFNADGYRDLESLYYYGANGGSVITFLWSPSQGEFVRMPEELMNCINGPVKWIMN